MTTETADTTLEQCAQQLGLLTDAAAQLGDIYERLAEGPGEVHDLAGLVGRAWREAHRAKDTAKARLVDAVARELPMAMP